MKRVQKNTTLMKADHRSCQECISRFFWQSLLVKVYRINSLSWKRGSLHVHFLRAPFIIPRRLLKMDSSLWALIGAQSWSSLTQKSPNWKFWRVPYFYVIPHRILTYEANREFNEWRKSPNSWTVQSTTECMSIYFNTVFVVCLVVKFSQA